jgi:hypothetical protein
MTTHEFSSIMLFFLTENLKRGDRNVSSYNPFKCKLQESKMNEFIEKYRDVITGVLSGFDRVVLRGTLRPLSRSEGMLTFLYRIGVLLKDFGEYIQQTTIRLKQASLAEAQQLKRPIEYLPSSSEDKDKIARKIMETDKIENGLICVLSCVEPCKSFQVRRDKEKKKLQLESKWRKCLHLYHYWIDEEFGFMSTRLQTWFPFAIQVFLNGREWLSRQLDKAGIKYLKSDNCFLNIEDLAGAQELMQNQLKLDWVSAMAKITSRVNPVFKEIMKGCNINYYWSLFQSEWATDVIFKTPGALAEIYPQLTQGAISIFSSRDVMRFLGGKICNGNFKGEVNSSYKKRPEGVRVKHQVNANSVKMYDKKGSMLRVETTINNPRDFKVYKKECESCEPCESDEPYESDKKGKRQWRRMRKGVSDIHHRAQVSQASNNRYLEALSGLNTDRKMKDLIEPVCQRVKWKGRPTRGLHPWCKEDIELLSSIRRGEFCTNGFRNRELVHIFYPHLDDFSSEKEKKIATSRITRKIRLLRAHGLIRKVPCSYRYVVSKKGNEIIPAILGYRECTLMNIFKVAA